jgi:hypothetical protein
MSAAKLVKEGSAGFVDKGADAIRNRRESKSVPTAEKSCGEPGIRNIVSRFALQAEIGNPLKWFPERELWHAIFF